jgi:hypothetical protein
MRREFISHFFLVPQTVPLAISCSISGWSDSETHAGVCWLVYRSKARIIAELPTVQPSASEAPWLSCFRMVSASWVSVWERTTRGCFWGVVLGRAISEIISHLSRGCYAEYNL